MMTDLIATALGFQDELRKRSAEIEKARQLPADIADRFAQAGFYRLCVPQAYGGVETDPLTLTRVIETLAEADGSSAWVVMICATTGLCAAYMPEAAAREVFADPSFVVAGVFAPRGKATDEGDHYRVNGRWQWGSGSPNAKAIMGGCIVTKNGETVLTKHGVPDVRMMMVPIAETELMDNWDVSGLCGTGSQDFAFKDRRVAKSRGVGLMSDKPLAR